MTFTYNDARDLAATHYWDRTGVTTREGFVVNVRYTRGTEPLNESLEVWFTTNGVLNRVEYRSPTSQTVYGHLTPGKADLLANLMQSMPYEQIKTADTAEHSDHVYGIPPHLKPPPTIIDVLQFMRDEVGKGGLRVGSALLMDKFGGDILASVQALGYVHVADGMYQLVSKGWDRLKDAERGPLSEQPKPETAPDNTTETITPELRKLAEVSATEYADRAYRAAYDARMAELGIPGW